MKHSTLIRLLSLVLTLSALLATLSSCGILSGMLYPEPEETEPEEPIPYHENYAFNDLKPTDSYMCDAYPYEDANSDPILMGGQRYHGGFVIRHSSGPYTPGYATFDVSHLDGKTLSFLLGGTEYRYNFLDCHSIFQVVADGKTVIDTVAWARKAPEWYTLDLSGVRELTFKIIPDESGECYVGVAEMTVWDGDPIRTGPAIPADQKSLQLVKDILPFSMENDSLIKLHTERVVSREENDGTYSGTYTRALWHIVNEPVTVAGKDYIEVLGMQSNMPLLGESVKFACFNLEEQFQYFSFTVGCRNEENERTGTSWLVIYADDERILEREIISDRLPQQITLDILNCRTLRIEIIHESGGSHYVCIYDAFVGKTEGDVGGSLDAVNVKDLPDVCKLISNIPPYAMASHVSDSPVLDGSTQHITFSMAGRKYNEGLMLLSQASFLTGNTGAHACFNLEGEFKYLTFRAGIMDKTPAVQDDALKIYLDGELSRTIPIGCLDMPLDYTIDLQNCQELKIELVGNESMVRPAYGIANMVLYRHEVVEHDLFPDPEVDFPDEMKLVENIKPYLYNFGPGEMGEYYYVYDGSLQHSFKVGDTWYHEGILLQTSVHADLYGSSGQGAMLMAAMTCMWMGGLMLLAGDTVYESSFAAFDLHGEFKTVTFTVACQDRSEFLDMPQTEVLKIGSNQKLFAELEIGSRMEPTTYTIEIENTDQLVFWLNCDSETSQLGGSSRYAIYDITVSK